MNLFPELKKKYTKETLNAREAQRLAEFIAFGTCNIPDCPYNAKTGHNGYTTR